MAELKQPPLMQRINFGSLSVCLVTGRRLFGNKNILTRKTSCENLFSLLTFSFQQRESKLYVKSKELVYVVKAYALDNCFKSINIVRIFAVINKSADIIAEKSSEILMSGIGKEAS